MFKKISHIHKQWQKFQSNFIQTLDVLMPTCPSLENLKGGLCLITLVASLRSPVSPSSSILPSWWSRISLLYKRIPENKVIHIVTPFIFSQQYNCQFHIKFYLRIQSAKCRAKASKSRSVVLIQRENTKFKYKFLCLAVKRLFKQRKTLSLSVTRIQFAQIH